ncbi:MAG TPA: tetratricopeptide repeat protein [Polyangiaceae bacterium]|nr:tetratricopeptide repeat protein [Polyangiaceae bacterium]
MNKRLTYLQQLIASGKADAFAHYALAMEHKKEGSIAAAGAAFEDLRAKFPDYVPQYLIAGQMYLDNNQPDVAADWLKRGLAVAGRMGDAKAVGEIEAALALC